MLCTNFSLLVMAAVLNGGAAMVSEHIPPPRLVVEYAIRGQPADPESAPVFSVALHLFSEQHRGNRVAWRMEAIVFTELDGAGAAQRIWTDRTPRDLWWVWHERIGQPQAAEFAVTPRLEGVAHQENPAGAALEYIFEGRQPTPAQSAIYQGPISAMIYLLKEAGQLDSLLKGTNEPEEITILEPALTHGF